MTRWSFACPHSLTPQHSSQEIASVVAGWRWQPVVQAVMSLRGVALLTGATLVAELGDLHRFASAP